MTIDTNTKNANRQQQSHDTRVEAGKKTTETKEKENVNEGKKGGKQPYKGK